MTLSSKCCLVLQAPIAQMLNKSFRMDSGWLFNLLVIIVDMTHTPLLFIPVSSDLNTLLAIEENTFIHFDYNSNRYRFGVIRESVIFKDYEIHQNYICLKIYKCVHQKWPILQWSQNNMFHFYHNDNYKHYLLIIHKFLKETNFICKQLKFVSYKSVIEINQTEWLLEWTSRQCVWWGSRLCVLWGCINDESMYNQQILIIQKLLRASIVYVPNNKQLRHLFVKWKKYMDFYAPNNPARLFVM